MGREQCAAVGPSFVGHRLLGSWEADCSWGSILLPTRQRRVQPAHCTHGPTLLHVDMGHRAMGQSVVDSWSSEGFNPKKARSLGLDPKKARSLGLDPKKARSFGLDPKKARSLGRVARQQTADTVSSVRSVTGFAMGHDVSMMVSGRGWCRGEDGVGAMMVSGRGWCLSLPGAGGRCHRSRLPRSLGQLPGPGPIKTLTGPGAKSKHCRAIYITSQTLRRHWKAMTCV